MGGESRSDERCDAARLVLSAGLDGESSELELAKAQHHVAGCASCEAFGMQSGALAGALRSASIVSPSRSLAPAAPRRNRRRPRAAAVAGSLAAVSAAAVLGAFVSARIQQAPAPPPAAELRIANLDTRQAQRVFAQRQVQALLNVPQSDPTIDRSLQLQRLG
jgi:predicted anti-sigma-YlaC factor YlaD